MRSLSKRTSMLLAVLLIGLTLYLPEATAQERIEREYVNGEVLVKFKPRVSRRSISDALDHAGLRIAQRYPEISLLKCVIKGRRSVARTVERCNDSRDILYAEPNFIYRTMIEPNDPRRRDMYGLTNIDAPLAWDRTTGSEAIVVGVIDTGVDDAHEDLMRNIWINQGEFGEGREDNGIDDDENGFVDDFAGWDFLNEDNDPFDDNDHGTHVSGTIGAVGNNNLGVVGVNWAVAIMPLKFLDDEGSGVTGDAIEAIIYGVNMGAKVLSNSWGGIDFSQALEEAIEFASDRGVLFVAAAGNKRTNNDAIPTYPASSAVENVISVAATTSGDNLSGFSNFGEETVDLGAPGSDILSTFANDRYGFFSGTSMATPHVSGAAALVLAQFPNITMRHLKIRLLGSVDNILSLNGLVSSGGRLNVNNAFTESPVIANTTPLDNTLDEFGPYVVAADVIDDKGLRTVMLTYQLEGEEAIAEVMTADGADHYRGEIPGQPLGSNIEYVVAATDEDGNVTRGRTFGFSIAEPPPDDDRICRFDAIEVGLRNSKWQTPVNIVANISFFILPIVYLRKRVQRQDRNTNFLA